MLYLAVSTITRPIQVMAEWRRNHHSWHNPLREDLQRQSQARLVKTRKRGNRYMWIKMEIYLFIEFSVQSLSFTHHLYLFLKFIPSKFLSKLSWKCSILILVLFRFTGHFDAYGDSCAFCDMLGTNSVEQFVSCSKSNQWFARGLPEADAHDLPSHVICKQLYQPHCLWIYVQELSRQFEKCF